MSVSKKDFVAEAADIRNHLTGNIPTGILREFIDARCTTLKAANPLFQRDAFEWACVSDEDKR
jgi:hypothetical protein